MNGDTGLKKAITETKLHEHQNSRETDASQSNKEPYRLPSKH